MMIASININQSANQATVCSVFGQPSDALVHPDQCVDTFYPLAYNVFEILIPSWQVWV